MRLPGGARLRSDRTEVRFSPNGLSPGSRIELVSGLRRRPLIVDANGAVTHGGPA